MSAEIVNLRRARKAKARAERERDAASNRAQHGLSKADRALATMNRERVRRELDGAQRDAAVASPENGAFDQRPDVDEPSNAGTGNDGR